MSDTEPAEDNRAANFAFKHEEGLAPQLAAVAAAQAGMAAITFDRNDLREIFTHYGRKVASGEGRDCGIDFTPQKAVFSVYGARANVRSAESRRIRGWHESKAPIRWSRRPASF